MEKLKERGGITTKAEETKEYRNRHSCDDVRNDGTRRLLQAMCCRKIHQWLFVEAVLLQSLILNSAFSPSHWPLCFCVSVSESLYVYAVRQTTD